MSILLFGVRDFETPIEGYQNNLLCPNCHNNSVAPVKRKEFISFWFIPVVPMYWGKQLRCHICTWRQDVNDEGLKKYGILPHSEAQQKPL